MDNSSLPRGSRYLVVMELGLKDHSYYGFWDLMAKSSILDPLGQSSRVPSWQGLE